MNQPPRFPDVGVIALVPDAWGSTWQPRHQILTRLTKFFRVLWVNPPHEWRHIWLRRSSGLAAKTPDTPPGFTVYTPGPFLPLVYRPAGLARLLERARLGAAKRILRRQGCRTIVLYLWRPEHAKALDLISHHVSCYHIDDEYSFSPVEQPTSEVEARLIRHVDQVFIHSRSLFDKKGALNLNTALVPNGVDFQAYATCRPEPHDLVDIPHPRIGYTGKLKRQLDWPLLLHLAQRHREWSFVFVGPTSPHPDIGPSIDALSRLPNVYFLGSKSPLALGAYPQHFDVCLMPYRVDDYTRYIYPLKLHEYLASGRPLVGSRIPALEEFADIVALANTPETWSAAIGALLTPTATSWAARAIRQEVARRFDWDVLVDRIAGIIVTRLGIERTRSVSEASGFQSIGERPSVPIVDQIQGS